MQSRVLHRLLAILLVGAFSLPVAAQYSRDASANQKIEEAINTHYLMMELDKAEKMLQGIVEACEMKCRPGTKAKAWMYVGIIRGSGKNDIAGAKEAFATAKAFDPSVQLDEALATPETKAAFQSVAGGAGGATTTQPTPSPSPAPSTAPPPTTEQGTIPGDMRCTPEQRQIQTRMPIPISCTSDLNPAGAVLKFQEFGSGEWREMEMQKVGGELRATIPCDVTDIAGPLLFYVGAKDKSGEYIDQYGSRKQPATIHLSETAPGPAPAFPGETPVTRCPAAEDCPPDFPGCGDSQDAQCGDLDWGSACDNSAQCKCGLTCKGGTCEQAQACSTDEDCSGGEACIGGYCSVAQKDAGPYKKHWVGGSFGADVTFIGGNQLCSQFRADGYSTYCLYSDGARYVAPPNQTGNGIEVAPAGPIMGQLRFKLSYDYALSDHMRVGAKAGVAFLNAPVPQSGIDVSPFMLLHLEGRFTYTFTSLAKKGFRPSAFLAVGLAEVSTGIPVQSTQPMDDRTLYVHKRAGLLMAGGGLTIDYAINDNMAVGFDLGAHLLAASYVPSVAIHPALSFTYGL